jgi:3',5'-cyclic AMP phosphodiesterase CpdA
VPLFGVLGNHEYSGSEKMWYYDFFAPPDNGSTANKEHWYAFTYGCARFIGLNACEGGDSFLPGSEQYQWLVNELQSAAFQNARWQFIWTHNPPYTSVEQDNTVDANMRTYLVPLFEQYGVDLVFAGHNHQYERSQKAGIYYIVTGGGGAPHHLDFPNLNPYSQVKVSGRYHAAYLNFDCSRGALNYSVYDSGSPNPLIDSLPEMIRGVPRLYLPVIYR